MKKEARRKLEEGRVKGSLTTQNKPSSNLTKALNSINTNKNLLILLV